MSCGPWRVLGATLYPTDTLQFICDVIDDDDDVRYDRGCASPGLSMPCLTWTLASAGFVETFAGTHRCSASLSPSSQSSWLSSY